MEKTQYHKNELTWIKKTDKVFKKLFIESVEYVESKKIIQHNLFNAMSKQPENKEKIKEYAQFYTPADVALYTAYQLLKNFNLNSDDIVFDPCSGKGSLLISAGAVLAIKYNLRGENLLSKLYGTEICHDTYLETIDNIISGLSSWIEDISYEKAKEILLNNIINKDFLNTDIPKNSYIIVNPPYKEIKGYGNMWLGFGEKITNDNNVKSFGMIVPVSICSADRTSGIREAIKSNFNEIVALHHDTRPRPLFKNIEQRISIVVGYKNNIKSKYNTTGFIGHNAGNRISVWESEYVTLDYKYCKKVFPKLTKNEIAFFKHHFKPKSTISQFICTNEKNTLWVRTTGRYYLAAQKREPDEVTTKWRKIHISETGANIVINDFINGTALKWWKIFGDGRDLSLNKFINNYGVGCA